MTNSEIDAWWSDIERMAKYAPLKPYCYADIMEKLSLAHELLTRVTGTPLDMYDQALAKDITKYLKLNKDITTYLNNTRKQ